MPLNRLIDLARRTGDRLVVHQPDKGEDIVIMDVDEYELLLDNRRDVRNLSDKQLLDQINRDISIWRVNSEIDESNFVDELDNEGDSDWLSAADVLEDRFEVSDFGIEKENDVERDVNKDWPEEGDISGEKFNDTNFNFTEELDEAVGHADETLNNVEKEPQVVPHKSVGDIAGIWEEEPLGDEEPVFYEEPV